ncbi:MAG: tetratricopeptide repeat protein, partial [Succinivibrio sp.]
LNDGVGCSNLGYLYDSGQGVKQDYKTATKYYEKSCELGESIGCNIAGINYEIGLGVKQSYSQAKHFYGKACDLGWEDGCSRYARLNKQGY